MAGYDYFLNRYSKQSYEMYIKMYGSLPFNSNGDAILKNNQVDAFRHSYTFGELTRMGIDAAEIIGAFHEFGRNNPRLEANMDLWNNYLGSIPKHKSILPLKPYLNIH